MRREIPSAAVMDPHEERRFRKVHRDLGYLDMRARNAAIRLYTACHLCTGSSQCDIAKKLFAIVGIVDCLRAQLDAIRDPPLLSVQEVGYLSSFIVACGDILDKIDEAKLQADESVRSGSSYRSPRANNTVSVFTPDEAIATQNLLEYWLCTVVQISVSATMHDVVRHANETDEEAFESLRLSAAIKHPDFHVRERSIDSPVREDKEPQNTTSSPQILKGTFPLHEQLSLYPRQIQSQACNKPNRTYNQWIPYRSNFANYEDYQHKIQSRIACELNNNNELPTPVEAEKESPLNTPASTRESTPTVEHGGVEAASQTEDANVNELVNLLSIDAVDITVVETTADINASRGPASSEITTCEPNTGDSPRAIVLGPSQHLEAYIIRPSTFTFKESITWSLEVEPLHLDEGAMQGYINRLGPSYSIIDAIGKLFPGQLRLVQAHTRSRQGRLISIQNGAPTDMVTPMGTFEIKTIIFIITTAAPPEIDNAQDNAGTFFSQREPNKPTFSSFNNAPWRPYLPPQPAFPTPSSNNVFQENSGLAFGATNEYRNYLHARGEDCFRLEADGNRQGNMDRYMTITTTDRHIRGARSLEEIRLEDYREGRTGPIRGDLFWYPWEASRGTGSENPFGEQYHNPKTGFGLGLLDAPRGPPIGGLFGDPYAGRGGLFGGRPTPSGGLFGNQILSDHSAQPAGGLFGRPSNGSGLFSGFGTHNNTSPSLFGQHTNPGQNVFGRAPLNAPNRGLFERPPTGGGLFDGFGAHNNNHNHNSADGSSFGQHKAPRPALFGTAAQAPPSTGNFGATSLFRPEHAAQTTGLYNTAPPSSSGTGLFGNPSNAAPTVFHPAQSHGCYPTSQPQSTQSSFCTNPRPNAPFNCGRGTPPPNDTNVPPLNPFGAQGPSNTTGDLFGAQPTTFSPAATPNITTTASTTSNPFALLGPPYTNTSTSTSPTASWSCKSCDTSLAFHPPAEHLAGECDACKGIETTACWLCKQKVKASESISAYADDLEKKQEGGKQGGGC